MTTYSLPQSLLQPNPGFHCSPTEQAVGEESLPALPLPGAPAAAEGRRCLTSQEWEALEDLAMSLHGVMRLIDEQGFDNSSGAQELLALVYRRFEKLLSEIRSRLEKEGEL